MAPNEPLDGIKGIECIGCCVPAQQFPLLDMTHDAQLQEGSWCVNNKQLHVNSLTFELLDLSKSGHQADTQPQKVRCLRHLPAL